MHSTPSPGDRAESATAGPPRAEIADQPQRFLNRELSWLDFNRRVLDLAADENLPLLERVRFLAIFASNLDEFFMKRVGGLQRQRAAGVLETSIDGLTVQGQLDAIRAYVEPMIERQNSLWLDVLKPRLVERGLRVLNYDELNEVDRQVVDTYFVKTVFPILTPLAVDPGHPFPFLSNLSISMGALLEHPNKRHRVFVRTKVPENLPRFVPLQTRGVFVPLEQVIGGNLSLLFPGMTVLEHQMFRVTRNADIETDEEDADDLLQMVELELRMRRMARVVRLELPQAMSEPMKQLITEGVEVDQQGVYFTRGPIDMSDLAVLASADFPAEKFRPWTPQIPPQLAGPDPNIFTAIRAADVMVHHPYESFADSVEVFIHSAVSDPRVLAIKLTLYRTSSDSPFVLSLIQAAEAGKQVAVLVELKARFDEQRNVKLAQTLENAGVHVVYGVVGLKTHTKLAMVVRDEPEGLRTYCHIGTGNYNSRTAQLYSDLGLFTCNPLIADDVVDLFHYLTGSSLKRDYRKLLVAPVMMRDRFVYKVRREAEHARAGRPARIVAKMNALQDPKLTDELYEASRAGVQIDLIVRGFCCLRPQVPGLSENIRVISILGRFLEHSRIYYFQNNGDEEYFIGSADWMIRNLDYRVEAIAPVESPEPRARLKEILDVAMSARVHTWELGADGVWTPRDGDASAPGSAGTGKPGTDIQVYMMSRALKAAHRRPAR